jgi:hypothetical protein
VPQRPRQQLCGMLPLAVAVRSLSAQQGARSSTGRPNISVNADVRELAFVHRRAGSSSIVPMKSLAARGRRLP